MRRNLIILDPVHKAAFLQILQRGGKDGIGDSWDRFTQLSEADRFVSAQFEQYPRILFALKDLHGLVNRAVQYLIRDPFLCFLHDRLQW